MKKITSLKKEPWFDTEKGGGVRFHQKKGEVRSRIITCMFSDRQDEGQRALGNAAVFVWLKWNVWGGERETLIAQLTDLRLFY
jgi:hypothetical protein